MKENKSNSSDRREFLKSAAVLAFGAAISGTDSELFASSSFAKDELFTLPKLGYGYNDLEPHIDSMTMEIHHSKHHAGYVNNLNKAIAGTPLEKMSLENILKNISEHPAAVRNNGGGHYNHSLFWKLMKPSSGGSPAGKLAEAVNASFNSFEEMKNRFSDAAKSVFGSGWAWLVLDSGKLKIGTTANQDNPLMNISELKGTPILALDVWEHAYYLKHMNKRADYISSWWNVVNWEFASELFGKAK